MKRATRTVAILSLGIAALAGVVVIINQPWFDESLTPELVALRDSRVTFAGDNAYPDIASLRKSDSAPAALPSLGCVARRQSDCATRLIAEIGQAGWRTRELWEYLERYEALIHHAHYIETRESGAGAPVSPDTHILNLGQLRLALSYHSDSTPDFLRKVQEDFAFWTMVMREAESLQAKMVALGAVQNDVDFITTRLRAWPPEPSELPLVQKALRPFTRAETDIGAGFLSEARVELGLEEPYVATDLPRLARLLFQKNATLNLGYREVIAPMVARASLDARQWYEQRAYEPIRYELRWRPATLYNLGGKLGWSRSTWDPWQFPPRVHDLDGRISLVLLQVEIAQRPGDDPAVVIRESSHRNPYTGGAFEYDGLARVMSFQCQETAYHPPDPPPRCAIALGTAIRRPAN